MDNTQDEIANLRKELEEFKGNFTLFMEMYTARQEQQDIAQERNTIAIEATNKNVSDLVAATKGLVEAWTVATGLQRFLKWFSTFAVLASLVTWVIAHLPSIQK